MTRSRPSISVPTTRLTIALLTMAAALGVAAGVAHAVTIGTWEVTFQGATYDEFSNPPTTTFTYEVAGPGSGNALSHITFGICADILPDGSTPDTPPELISYGRTPPIPGTTVIEIGTDSTTQVRGIKFECNDCTEFQEPDTTATYTYEVEGLWATADVQVGLKYGSTNPSGTVTGPDCSSVDLDVITTCADYDTPNPYYRNEVTQRNQNKTATGVTLTDTLPPDVAYDTYSSSGVAGSVSCSGDGLNPETVTCTLSALTDTETWVLDIYIIDNTTGSQQVTHSVDVTANEAEAYTFNNEDACTTTNPVSISYFTSERNGDSTRFEWSTETETGNIGFNLYGVYADGSRKMLNDGLIPSKVVDSLERVDYTLVLDGVDAESFVIEDIDITTRTTRQGPFQLGEAYGERLTDGPIDWDAIRDEHLAKAERRAAEAIDLAVARVQAARSMDADTWRIRGDIQLDTTPHQTMQRDAGAPYKRTYPPFLVEVTDDGMQRLTYEALRDAGLDLAGVPASHIAMVHRGEPVPLLVRSRGTFRPGDAIEFHGLTPDSLYTDREVYELVVEHKLARRIPVDRGHVKVTEFETVYTAHRALARQRRYSVASPNGDPWYDTRMLVYRSPKSWTFPIEVDNLAADGAPPMLTVDLWGVTQWSQFDPDHHVQLLFNGHLVADEYLDGLVRRRMSVPVDDLIHEGTNQLTIAMPADTAADFDLINFEGYELSYPRHTVARDGVLRFDGHGRGFEVRGLPSPDVRVVRITDDGPVLLTRVTSERGPDGYTVRFIDGEGAPATYEVRTQERMLRPSVRPAPETADITTAPSELLIISHPDFIDGLRPLVERREAQGYSVQVVDVTDIYAQFGHHRFGPQPIADYIEFAVEQLGTQYVLLVGGDTYDYLNHLGRGAIGFIPTKYVRTGSIVGFAPVDALYADVDDDYVPDVAIGRLPVRTSTDLEAILAKMTAYENKDYHRTAVFSSDVGNRVESYRNVSEGFVAGLSGQWDVRRSHLDELSVGAARSELIDAINDGAALTSFLGHSSLTRWTFSGLFAANDVAKLQNQGRPTVVNQWGCWNTYFVSPDYNSLGHRFMLEPEVGAAAVMGASTLTDSDAERELGKLVMPLLTKPGLPIGEAILQGKRTLAEDHPDMRDVILGWTLLGDPTLVIAEEQ